MARRQKLIVFLALLTAIQFGFPVTFYSDVVHSAYPFLYGAMFLFGILVVRLGYGEVLPVSPWARSLAIFETVAGTLFLATVIARLVGAYSSGTKQTARDGAGGSEPA